MNGELSRVDAEAFANAMVAAAVASLPDQNGQHHLSHHQVLGLQAQADQDEPEGFGATQDGQGQQRKPRKLRKPNEVARCQVDGCGRDLSDAKLYLRRYSVCEPHFKAEWVTLGGGRYRFCQQCNKFQSLDNFSGSRRSCKARSEDRNLRRRKQRTDERTMGGDEAEAGSARMLKAGPHSLGPLAMPSRVALTDNGMLRQLGDPNDPASQLGAAQYASQVQQLLFASGGAVAAGLAAPGAASGAGTSSVLGGQLQVQVPPGLDLAAALASAADLSGLTAAAATAQNANALSLLTAAASGAGRGGGGPPALLDPAAVGGNVLQQLQIAQLASALAKGGTGATGGGGAGAAAGVNGGLAAALGSMAGLGVGLNAGSLGASLNAAGALGAGLNGGNLAQQLLLQQAAVAAAAAGAGAAGGGGGGASMGPAQEAAAITGAATASSPGLVGNLDLPSLMAQQLLQQTTAAGQGGPLVLLSNQNVMVLSLDQLGLLPQSAK